MSTDEGGVNVGSVSFSIAVDLAGFERDLGRAEELARSRVASIQQSFEQLRLNLPQQAQQAGPPPAAPPVAPQMAGPSGGGGGGAEGTEFIQVRRGAGGRFQRREPGSEPPPQPVNLSPDSLAPLRQIQEVITEQYRVMRQATAPPITPTPPAVREQQQVETTQTRTTLPPPPPAPIQPLPRVTQTRPVYEQRQVQQQDEPQQLFPIGATPPPDTRSRLIQIPTDSGGSIAVPRRFSQPSIIQRQLTSAVTGGVSPNVGTPMQVVQPVISQAQPSAQALVTPPAAQAVASGMATAMQRSLVMSPQTIQSQLAGGGLGGAQLSQQLQRVLMQTMGLLLRQGFAGGALAGAGLQGIPTLNPLAQTQQVGQLLLPTRPSVADGAPAIPVASAVSGAGAGPQAGGQQSFTNALLSVGLTRGVSTDQLYEQLVIQTDTLRQIASGIEGLTARLGEAGAGAGAVAGGGEREAPEVEKPELPEKPERPERPEVPAAQLALPPPQLALPPPTEEPVTAAAILGEPAPIPRRRARGAAARQLGGPAGAREAYLVGERGPELFVPGQTGYVLPAERTRQLRAEGGGVQTGGPVRGELRRLESDVEDVAQSGRRGHLGRLYHALTSAVPFGSMAGSAIAPVLAQVGVEPMSMLAGPAVSVGAGLLAGKVLGFGSTTLERTLSTAAPFAVSGAQLGATFGAQGSLIGGAAGGLLGAAYGLYQPELTEAVRRHLPRGPVPPPKVLAKAAATGARTAATKGPAAGAAATVVATGINLSDIAIDALTARRAAQGQLGEALATAPEDVEFWSRFGKGAAAPFALAPEHELAALLAQAHEIPQSEAFISAILDQATKLAPRQAGGPVDPAMLTALEQYQTGSALTLNRALRSGARLSPEQQSQVEQLDRLIRAAPALEQSRTFYRGRHHLPTELRGLAAEQMVGMTVTDPGFVSTSDNPMAAGRFGDLAEQTITVPAGRRALNVGETLGRRGHYEGEEEHLLPRGSQFQVTSAEAFQTRMGDTAHRLKLAQLQDGGDVIAGGRPGASVVSASLGAIGSGVADLAGFSGQSYEENDVRQLHRQRLGQLLDGRGRIPLLDAAGIQYSLARERMGEWAGSPEYNARLVIKDPEAARFAAGVMGLAGLQDAVGISRSNPGGATRVFALPHPEGRLWSEMEARYIGQHVTRGVDQSTNRRHLLFFDYDDEGASYDTETQAQLRRAGLPEGLLQQVFNRGLRADAQLLTFSGDRPADDGAGGVGRGSYLHAVQAFADRRGSAGRSLLQRPDFQHLLPDAVRAYAAAGVSVPADALGRLEQAAGYGALKALASGGLVIPPDATVRQQAHLLSKFTGWRTAFGELDLDPTQTRPAFETLARLSQQYPIGKSVGSIGVFPAQLQAQSPSAIAAYNARTSQMVLNPMYFGTEPTRARLGQQVDPMLLEQWRAQGMALPPEATAATEAVSGASRGQFFPEARVGTPYIVAHEYGHAIHAFLDPERGIGMHAQAKPGMRAEVERFLEQQYSSMRRPPAPSQYFRQSPFEAFGETFAGYYFGSQAPAAQQLGGILKEQFGKAPTARAEGGSVGPPYAGEHLEKPLFQITPEMTDVFTEPLVEPELPAVLEVQLDYQKRAEILREQEIARKRARPPIAEETLAEGGAVPFKPFTGDKPLFPITPEMTDVFTEPLVEPELPPYVEQELDYPDLAEAARQREIARKRARPPIAEETLAEGGAVPFKPFTGDKPLFPIAPEMTDVFTAPLSGPELPAVLEKQLDQPDPKVIEQQRVQAIALARALEQGEALANGGAALPRLIGKRGPELFAPDQAGYVLSHEQTRQALGRAAGGETGAQPYLVGERGPELYVPGQHTYTGASQAARQMAAGGFVPRQIGGIVAAIARLLGMGAGAVEEGLAEPAETAVTTAVRQLPARGIGGKFITRLQDVSQQQATAGAASAAALSQQATAALPVPAATQQAAYEGAAQAAQASQLYTAPSQLGTDLASTLARLSDAMRNANTASAAHVTTTDAEIAANARALDQRRTAAQQLLQGVGVERGLAEARARTAVENTALADMTQQLGTAYQTTGLNAREARADIQTVYRGTVSGRAAERAPAAPGGTPPTTPTATTPAAEESGGGGGRRGGGGGGTGGFFSPTSVARDVLTLAGVSVGYNIGAGIARIINEQIVGAAQEGITTARTARQLALAAGPGAAGPARPEAIEAEYQAGRGAPLATATEAQYLEAARQLQPLQAQLGLTDEATSQLRVHTEQLAQINGVEMPQAMQVVTQVMRGQLDAGEALNLNLTDQYGRLRANGLTWQEMVAVLGPAGAAMQVQSAIVADATRQEQENQRQTDSLTQSTDQLQTAWSGLANTMAQNIRPALAPVQQEVTALLNSISGAQGGTGPRGTPLAQQQNLNVPGPLQRVVAGAATGAVLGAIPGNVPGAIAGAVLGGGAALLAPDVLRSLGLLPGYNPTPRQLGGSAYSGQGYTVGEHGPELFLPGTSQQPTADQSLQTQYAYASLVMGAGQPGGNLTPQQQRQADLTRLFLGHMLVGQQRQHGGATAGRQPYLVGERGAELFVPDQSGYVLSHEQTKKALAAGAVPRQVGGGARAGGAIAAHQQEGVPPQEIANRLQGFQQWAEEAATAYVHVAPAGPVRPFVPTAPGHTQEGVPPQDVLNFLQGLPQAIVQAAPAAARVAAAGPAVPLAIGAQLGTTVAGLHQQEVAASQLPTEQQRQAASLRALGEAGQQLEDTFRHVDQTVDRSGQQLADATGKFVATEQAIGTVEGQRAAQQAAHQRQAELPPELGGPAPVEGPIAGGTSPYLRAHADQLTPEQQAQHDQAAAESRQASADAAEAQADADARSDAQKALSLQESRAQTTEQEAQARLTIVNANSDLRRLAVQGQINALAVQRINLENQLTPLLLRQQQVQDQIRLGTQENLDIRQGLLQAQAAEVPIATAAEIPQYQAGRLGIQAQISTIDLIQGKQPEFDIGDIIQQQMDLTYGQRGLDALHAQLADRDVKQDIFETSQLQKSDEIAKQRAVLPQEREAQQLERAITPGQEQLAGVQAGTDVIDRALQFADILASPDRIQAETDFTTAMRDEAVALAALTEYTLQSAGGVAPQNWQDILGEANTTALAQQGQAGVSGPGGQSITASVANLLNQTGAGVAQLAAIPQPNAAIPAVNVASGGQAITITNSIQIDAVTGAGGDIDWNGVGQQFQSLATQTTLDALARAGVQTPVRVSSDLGGARGR